MSSPRIVVLGMMTRMPVAGVVWQNVHYLVGLQRMGYEVYYVEAHGIHPSMLTRSAGGSGTQEAVAFLDRILDRFGLGDRWAYHALHDDGGQYGPVAGCLDSLYRSAAMVLNLHGGTNPAPEHAAGKLIYLETDPVHVQAKLEQGDPQLVEFLDQHVAHFTFAERYGRPGCRLPRTDRYDFRPTRQPVVLDLWRHRASPGESFTTVGNWRQTRRDFSLGGESYTWSKHHEFLKVRDLPSRTTQPLELALSSNSTDTDQLLTRRGWRVRSALDLSEDLDIYRAYIAGSRGEFTVAKDQNIRFRTGWFSDRSATYLAAGRPVVTQDTGFDSVLPTGEGLFAWSTPEEAVGAIDRINVDWHRHAAAARDIAHEYFDAGRVLKHLMSEAGA